MDEEKKKIAIKTIQDAFSAKEKFSDNTNSQNFQLFISQLDLFKNLAALITTILGIGYFLNDKLDKNYLFISFAFSVFTLFGTISYTREKIDLESKEINHQDEILREKMDDLINANMKAILNNNYNLSLEYAEKELKKIQKIKNELIYSGEIFNFCFYNSIIFLFLAYFNLKLDFKMSCALALIIAYILSFKSWSSTLIKKLSININSADESS